MARRSVLFSPGDRPELLRKASQTEADVIVFDLEDAVSPARKDDARSAVRSVLTDPDFSPTAEVCVRLSGVDDRADLAAICADGSAVDAIMRSKVDDPAQIDELQAQLMGYDDDLTLYALIETAQGVLNAEAIAAATATDVVVFGAEDLAADLGATRTTEGTEVLYARERVVLAASAANIDAIDTLYTDFSDTEGLRTDTEFSLTLGFDGKLAIHPNQVPVINDAFTPTDEQLEWAKKVLAARDEAAASDRGVFQVAGEMIDAPLIAQAERILERAA